MDKKQTTPVRIGKGKKIHAGYVTRTEKRGKDIYEHYQALCSSGSSSFFHSYRRQHARPTTGTVNCKKCLQAIASSQ